MARGAFAASCLLRARLKAPFVDCRHVLMQDRAGVSIWWWDAAALFGEAGREQSRVRDVPESICQKLPDGWYHLQLENGYEARHVRRGMVIASFWRRTPFSAEDWCDTVAPGQDHMAVDVPPLSIVEPATGPVRPTGGRVVRAPMAAGEKLLLLALFLASVLGGWWQGQATALQRSAQKANREAERLEAFVSRYPLFAEIRSDLRDINAAQKALGRTTAATDLAQVLAHVSDSGLQLVAFELDDARLELRIVTGADDDRIRTLAARIEAMAAFVHVAAQSADADGEMQLTAEVSR